MQYQQECKMKIKIGDKEIGGKRVFIIAEIGSNHNRNLKQGKELINVAKEAGADSVKFQSFTAENFISKRVISSPTLKTGKTPFDVIKKSELPYPMYAKFKSYAESNELICFSTPSHPTDIDKLNEIGISLLKIGSAQITDLPMIEYTAKQGRPIILSTAASTLREISEAVRVIESVGNKNIILLHCTMLYPTQPDQTNLKVIRTLRKNFPDAIIGYSDHTLEPIVVPVAAVAIGARVIEKHLTLNRKLKGPDHPFALEPQEFEMMVKGIRAAEKAIGSKEKKVLPEEAEIAMVSRKSLIATKNLKRGQIIASGDIIIKRPGYGIPPKFLQVIIGQVLTRSVKEDDVVTWKIFQERK